MVHIFDIANPSNVEPTLSFQAHDGEYVQAYPLTVDVISAVQFHPTLPFLVSCSGSRVFPEPNDDSSDSEASSEPATLAVPKPIDASLKLWRFSVLEDQPVVSSAVLSESPQDPSQPIAQPAPVSTDA